MAIMMNNLFNGYFEKFLNSTKNLIIHTHTLLSLSLPIQSLFFPLPWLFAPDIVSDLSSAPRY